MKNEILGHPIVNQTFNMSVDEARKYLEDNGYTMRIINQDGKPLMVTTDYVENRVNVFTKNGKVFDIRDLG